jgi:hypothetical protein
MDFYLWFRFVFMSGTDQTQAQRLISAKDENASKENIID